MPNKLRRTSGSGSAASGGRNVDILYIACVTAVALLSIAGTLCPAFDDNLLQRTALALIGLAASTEAWGYFHGSISANPRTLLLLGFAIYGIGSALKTWRYARIKT